MNIINIIRVLTEQHFALLKIERIYCELLLYINHYNRGTSSGKKYARLLIAGSGPRFIGMGRDWEFGTKLPGKGTEVGLLLVGTGGSGNEKIVPHTVYNTLMWTGYHLPLP